MQGIIYQTAHAFSANPDTIVPGIIIVHHAPVDTQTVLRVPPALIHAIQT